MMAILTDGEKERGYERSHFRRQEKLWPSFLLIFYARSNALLYSRTGEKEREFENVASSDDRNIPIPCS